MPDGRVLVVGTTSDYVDWIRCAYPDQALFLTDPDVRQAAKEPTPSSGEEILTDLVDFDNVYRSLHEHLCRYQLRLKGLVCFDCESMLLSAFLAQKCLLDYPSPDAVLNCRNKYLSKLKWQRRGVGTPSFGLVSTSEDAERFLSVTGTSIVLKPLTGSGSELVFKCDSPGDCHEVFHQIKDGLRQRRTHRLYHASAVEHSCMLAEAQVQGDEYSCDFLIENSQVTILRLTKKIFTKDMLFGVTLGYICETGWPKGLCEWHLQKVFSEAAAALGIRRALCMVDFIVQDCKIVLLELTPRPGGDCIPFLLQKARGLDILKLFIAFSCGEKVCDGFPLIGSRVAALRIFARKAGRLERIDIHRIAQNAHASDFHIIRGPGHCVTMPPADYDSWYLGHFLYCPQDDDNYEMECRNMLDEIDVSVVMDGV